jgi:hypothetical protein
MKHAKSQGFKKLDLGSSDHSPSPYFSKFDPVLEPFWTLEKTDTLYKIGLRAMRSLRGLKK